MSTRLAGFPGFLRANGFAVGGGDGVEVLRTAERVGVMDVSTLGKFLVAGRDAKALLDWAFPLDVGAIAAGRARYLLALDEGHGFAKKANTDFAFYAQVEFLRRTLLE